MDGGAGSASEQADLELVRICVSPEGCFSVLLLDGVPAGPVCLERSYPIAPSAPRGAQYVKIPAGRYRCVRTRFERGGYDTYEVTGVVGHSRLLFHAGDVEGDSEACILVGLRFGVLSGGPAVLGSRDGHAELMRIACGRSSFELLVRAA